MKITIFIVRLISRLPLGLLYGLSNVFFFIIYYIIGYRKKVVLDNLKHSFPNKTERELKQIRKEFYVNFSDYLVETIKAFTISSENLNHRVQHLNQQLFINAKNEQKNIILLAGHIFNWEWYTALSTKVPQEFCHPVYRKASSQLWNEQLQIVRNRFGNQSIEAQDTIKHIFRNNNDGNSIYMFLADQSPQANQVDIGLNFLNQTTPVFIGYDKLSTRMDLAFFYCEMKKVKRGYYQINYQQIVPDHEKFEDFEVVKKFHKLLNNNINKQPSNYLWTHRRWKNSGLIKQFLD